MSRTARVALSLRPLDPLQQPFEQARAGLLGPRLRREELVEGKAAAASCRKAMALASVSSPLTARCTERDLRSMATKRWRLRRSPSLVCSREASATRDTDNGYDALVVVAGEDCTNPRRAAAQARVAPLSGPSLSPRDTRRDRDAGAAPTRCPRTGTLPPSGRLAGWRDKKSAAKGSV